MPYKDLIAEVRAQRPDLNVAEVERAYEFAKAAHEGQKRYSGEPYIIHPVEAARILLSLNPDLATVQACLLHDVTEDTDVPLSKIEQEFGSEVASLVEGMEKLAIVKMPNQSQKEEQWKKMFLAMAEDIRIVFIKLSDRLHNMRTLQHVPEEKRERIARESLMVHAAIASRLGIYKIKSELEDLCFRYLHAEAHAELNKKLDQYKHESETQMEAAVAALRDLLMEHGIVPVEVQSRFKHLWSIHKKMEEKDTENLDDIHDLFAVRVILRDKGDEVSHLYAALGVIHGAYIPMQDRFKDYVAVPKPNGYRSLHTTVLGMDKDPDEATEIQIRTETMHKEAEMGLASHWSYKEGVKSGHVDPKRHRDMEAALKKIQALVDREPDLAGITSDWVERYQHLSPEDRAKVEKVLREHGIEQSDLDAVRVARGQEKPRLQQNMDRQLAWLRGLAEHDGSTEIDLFPNKIFVLTPQREVIELPKGATPVDFAYLVHTEVGNKMVHAKANGRIVPLDYELQNGEMMEIGTRNNGKPSRYWISLAKTSSARAKIRNWFNRQDKESNVAAGRALLNKELETYEKPLLDDKYSLLKDYAGKPRDFKDREQLLEGLGLGSVSVAQVVKTLFPGIRTRERRVVEMSAEAATEEVLVTGEPDLPVVLSACCKPRPPMPIIGYVTRGRSIRIHRESCSELAGLEGERFVSARWR